MADAILNPCSFCGNPEPIGRLSSKNNCVEADAIHRVAAFINGHGVGCFVKDGTIYAEDVYTLKGETHSDWKVIKPSIAAAKEFLNY